MDNLYLHNLNLLSNKRHICLIPNYIGLPHIVGCINTVTSDVPITQNIEQDQIDGSSTELVQVTQICID